MNGWLETFRFICSPVRKIAVGRPGLKGVHYYTLGRVPGVGIALMRAYHTLNIKKTITNMMFKLTHTDEIENLNVELHDSL